MRFKEWSYLHNSSKYWCRCCSKFSRRSCWDNNECSYTIQQVFNLDKTALYWKKMSSRTFIGGEEKSMPDFKASTGKLTLLVTLSWSQCSFTILKILVPLRKMQNILFVLCKWNSKAWITTLLNSLSPLLRSAAQKKKYIYIYFNVLLLLTMNLVTQELWQRGTMRLMLLSSFNIHSEAYESRSNFNFQVLLSKKYIL